MQDGGSVRELLRASATDADAVRQYLQSIDSEEVSHLCALCSLPPLLTNVRCDSLLQLNGLLDGIAPRDAKRKNPCKDRSEFLVQDDWLPLVHLLVHCESTRLRAASRIVQVLRRGAPSELESMQLLTEINLGYASALDELQESRRKPMTQHTVQRRKLLEEINTVLEIVFSFLSEVVEETTSVNAKVLPQLLGLVPYFLGMLSELCGSNGDDRASKENLAKLLELPWQCYTVSSLLDVLVDDASWMSRESWHQLQGTVARMVTTSPEMASETMNPIIRTCILVANVTGNHKWIAITRYLLRQLPLHLRQEAEFNFQMSLHQSPRIVSLVCESIRSSIVTEEVVANMEDTTDPAETPATTSLDLALHWCDIFLLLHSLQASKPILHHRTSSSRVATEALVFAEIEHLAWWIVSSDIEEFLTASSSLTAMTPQMATKTLEKHLLGRVEYMLNFGGKQIHAREWKALLLMDTAFYWIEETSSVQEGNADVSSKPSVALLLLQAIFQTAPETRSEVLSCLFERSQKPGQRKITEATLSQLFISQSSALFPHLNAVQDWLSMQFQRSFDSSRECFLIASQLATAHKDLYNFLMVFLRKLLSTGNRVHQEFAVDMWCTWLDHTYAFNEQQEEEIVSALKNGMIACHDIRAWSFGRLEQVFHPSDVALNGPAVMLRKSSWEELYRFLSQEIAGFIQPGVSRFAGYRNGDDEDSTDEFDDCDGLSRFRFCSLDAFYQQNSSLDGAAVIGIVFQKLLSCTVSFEKAVMLSKVSSEGLEIDISNANDRDFKQWLVDLVSNWKYFFHWICQDSDDVLSQSLRNRVGKSVWWKLLARTYIGCAVCNFTIEILLCCRPVECVQWTGHNYDSGISFWSLVEVEFSLHRMVHKLAAQSAAEMDTALSKEYLKAASFGLHHVLQPRMLQILKSIQSTLANDDALPTRNNSQTGEISFGAVLFVLNSCWNALGSDDRYGAFFPQASMNSDALNYGASVLESLLSIYLNIRDRMTATPKPSNVESTNNDEGEDMSKLGNKLCFSFYAETISAKFPLSARHLVLPAKTAKTVTLLDAKAGEELMEHVCTAIGRTLEMMTSIDFHSTHDHLGRVLRQIPWNGRNQDQLSHHGNHFLALACLFLIDANKYIQLDGLAKLGVSCAWISKRLSDISADVVVHATDHAEWLQLSAIAYDAVCENAVYNPRLLRLLLSICLPTYLAIRLKTFVSMENKIKGIINACSLNTLSCKFIFKKTREGRRHQQLIRPNKRDLTPGKRKRLRQRFDARSPCRLRAESVSDARYFSESDEPIRSDVGADLDSDSSSSDQVGPERVPHLHSQVSQYAAVLAVLVVVEHSSSTLLSTLTNKDNDGWPCTFSHHQEILGYIRIHDLVNQAISNNRQFTYGNRKVLLKVLHMIELDLRIGKASGALRKVIHRNSTLSYSTIIHIFESSVLAVLRCRTWIDGIKDANQDSVMKTRVSATVLKMDIFFLQAPGFVQTWMKENTLDDDLKERLKALSALVKERITPADQAGQHSGKTKARQRLLGVIPIVKRRRKRLRSRHPIIDAFLHEESGADAFADLEDFIE